MNSRKNTRYTGLFREDQEFTGDPQVLLDDGREINLQGNRRRRRKRGDFVEAVGDFFTPPASFSGLVADALGHLSWNGLALVACNLVQIHIGLWWGASLYLLLYGTYVVLWFMLAAADYPNWRNLGIWRIVLLVLATLIVRIW